MKSTPEYPFKYLEFYLENQIKSDWNKYKKGLIENEFYSSYDSVDEGVFMIKIYNSEFNEFDLYSFEAEVLRKIQKKIYEADENILIGFSRQIKQKDLIKNFAEELANQYNKLIKSSFEHPFLAKHFRPLKNRITDYYPLIIHLFDKEPNSIETPPKNLLKLKSKFKIAKIGDIYEEAVEFNIFDQDETPFDSFHSVLTKENSYCKIYFNCNGVEMFTFLDCLSSIFKEFNARIIEESEFFYTKKGIILKQSNYNKIKHLAKLKSQEKSISLIKKSITAVLKDCMVK